MKLSIIVPVYNMASDGKLNYCLDSLAAQTISDYEVITVDDASTDESFSILLEYEKKYPGKFKAVHSEVNKRQGGAKNIGLSLAKGEWIGFIDSDDWILPTMYEKLIGRAEETGADMVGCDYCLTDEHSMRIGKRVENGKAEQSGVLGNKQCRSLILDSGSLVVKVYRREIFMDSGIRFPEHIFYEDNAISDAVGNQQDFQTVLCNLARFGYLETYRPEICFEYTMLFYVNTLFSYMVGKGHKSLSFIRKMGNELKEAFPNFADNPYYQERVNAEQKKMIAMQQRSTAAFVLYYKALWTWRNFRKKHFGKK